MLETAWGYVVTGWDWIMSNLIYINIILAILIVFFQRREPMTVWAWLLVLYFIPILGFLLYLVLGQDLHKKHMFKMKEIEDEMNYAIRKQEETIYKNEFEPENEEMSRFSNLILYNLEASHAVYTTDNEVSIYTDGNDKLKAVLEEIKKARHYVHLQYYIIKNDEMWKPIEDLLEQKVKEGVEVRILYDSMGCRSMKASDWKRIRSKGIITGEFFPAVLKKFQMRLNYRNHRKIIIIDGKSAFVGGFNIGREYLGLNQKKFGYWRDTHLKISGSAVLSLHIRFILDWNYATKQNLFVQDKYFVEQEGMVKGRNAIQIISSGPDSKVPNVRDNYLRLIHMAQNHIYIQTPYFIPDESVLDALKIAASSGVDVRVMIPCKPDHPFVYWCTYSYIEDLLEAGAKCYTYDDGFLHAKTLTVDGLVSCVGTANMDIRSFKLNFEVNATIYNQDTAYKLEQIFLNDLKRCTHVTPYVYASRSLLIRFKEQFCRLLSPLL